MNWHHHNTRRSSEVFFNQLMVNFGKATPGMEAMLKKKHEVIADIFRILEFWLRHGNLFLVSASSPTVVDLSCYNEVIQLEVMGLLDDLDAKFPKSAAWLKRMKVATAAGRYCQVDGTHRCCIPVSPTEHPASRRDGGPHGQVLQEVQAGLLQALAAFAHVTATSCAHQESRSFEAWHRDIHVFSQS